VVIALRKKLDVQLFGIWSNCQIDHKNQVITLSASTVTFSSHITQKIFNKPFLWPEKEMG